MSRSKGKFWTIDRRVNWRFLVPCCAVVAALVVAVIAAHQVQASKNADFLLRKSQALAEDGEIAEAARYLRLFVGMNPDDDGALTQLGLLLAQVGTPSADFEAQDRLLQVLRRHPNRMDVRKALLDLCLRMGNSRQALREIESLKQAAAKDPALWTMIGEAYQANRRNAEALEAYNNAILADPKNLLAQRQELALLTQLHADKDGIETKIETMLKANPSSPSAWLIAHVARRDNRLPRAKESLDKALELGPVDVEVLLMAAGERVQNHPGQAGEFLSRALAIAPNDPRVLLLHGRWLEARGERDKALELYLRGYEATKGRDPVFAWRIAEIFVERREFPMIEPYLVTLLSLPSYRPVYLYLRGRMDLLEGNAESALPLLKEALAILEAPGRRSQATPNDQEWEYVLQLALASAYSQRGELSQALDAARQAHRLLPRESLPLSTLASLFMRTQDFGAAADAWRETIARPPVPPQAYVELARALFLQEMASATRERNFTAFSEAFATAQRKIPDAPELVLLEADFQIAEGKVDQAITTLRAGVQGHPKDASLALSLCRILVLAGDLHRAESAIADTYRTFGSSVPLTVLLARIEWERGNREKAQSILEVALKRVPTTDSALKRVPTTDSALKRSVEPERGEILVAMASIAWSRGKLDSALEYLRDAANDSDLGKTALVDFLLFRYRLEELEDFIAAIRREEGDRGVTWRWADSLLAYYRYLEKPSWSKPILDAHLAVLRAQAPERWETAEIAGLAAELAGDSRAALRAYRSAVFRGPAEPLLVERYVRLLVRNEEFAEAKEIATRATRERFATPLDTRILITSTCGGAGVPAALANAERIAAGVKEDLATQLWLASLFELAGKTAEAESKYRELSLAFPSEMLPWLLYARLAAQIDLHKRDQLLVEVKERASVDNVPYLLGHCSLAFGDGDAATREFTVAAERGPLAEVEWRTVLEILRARQAKSFPALLARATSDFSSAYWLRGLSPTTQ